MKIVGISGEMGKMRMMRGKKITRIKQLQYSGNINEGMMMVRSVYGG